MQGTSWTVDQHMLAAIEHAARVANWQRSGGKGKGGREIDPPEPLRSPEQQRRKAEKAAEEQRSRAALRQRLIEQDRRERQREVDRGC